ncbi:DUF6603 domain-containing protein [Cellulomonas sp. URHD0024]|uniref:DUF6603 domain-containing protein n=1 Tax=Cellulomonas sp. URHD0024 TaxID=1302620 RepID=UPI000429A6DE|nr:DUF6603 domain-containing protein [Cellulomonas sp. URHD0024]
MSESNALEALVDTLLDIVKPLTDATADERTLLRYLAGTGWTVQAIDLDDVATAVSALVGALEDLATDLSFDSLPKLIESLGSLSGAATAISDFAQSLAAAVGDPQAAAEVVGALAADVLQDLVITWIASTSPTVHAVLSLLGIIDERVATPLATAGPRPLLARAALARPQLAPEAFAALLTDPVAHLQSRLGVQTLTTPEAAEAMTLSLLTPLLELVSAAGGSGTVGADPAAAASGEAARRQGTLVLPLPVGETEDPVRSWVTLVTEFVPVGETSVAGDAGPGISLRPGGGLTLHVDVPGGTLDVALTAGFGSVFLPSGGTPVLEVLTPEGVHVVLGFARGSSDDATPSIVLGSDTIGLTIKGLRADVDARFGRSDDSRLDLDVSAGVQAASFRLAPGEGDGFLGKVLPPDGLHLDFDLTIGWATARGLYFRGSAGLEVEIPVHKSLLGVLTIDIVYLELKASEQGFGLAVALTARLKLGPIAATIERMGLRAQAEVVPGGGNVGPFDVSPAFVPPKGAGLVINASIVTGGGYVLNDPEQGRYAGILQLKIGDVVTVTAIGLVSTKLPDGSRGFSLLVIITATFPPIQLGFGFNLSGLGGLLGLNRTMNVQALRDGARTGVLDSILFPVDPVARATKVISDVEAVFPIAPGRFVIGLMARIGWGSPRLVTVDLGIVIEVPLPVRIALLGRVAVVLPADDTAVVELHLDVVGILDLGRGELSIDASLHDSRLAVFDIAGDMALRVGWGATPVFVVSVGGLNPRFERPPGLPDVRRLSIALASGENPSVRLETYLALTSNTIQVGARLSAHAELDAGVFGLFTGDAWLGFDALITIVPFEFVVDISGGITIKRNGSPFIGAEVLLTLYGPQPMRAVGYAEVHFLGTHRLPFDVTVGPDAVQAVLVAVDPIGALLQELARIEAWSAQPPLEAPGVSLRDQTTDALVAHPAGELSVRQRVVPLGVRIERFGGASLPGGPRSYALTYRIGGTSAIGGTVLRDAWAPGDLFALADDQKLSRPSFEQLPSGATGIAAPGLSHGAGRPGAEDDYETRVLDADDLPRPAAGYEVPGDVQPLLIELHTARATTGYGGAAFGVRAAPPRYQLVDTSGLAAAGTPKASWLEAEETREGRAHGDLQVVGAHEVRG